MGLLLFFSGLAFFISSQWFLCVIVNVKNALFSETRHQTRGNCHYSTFQYDDRADGGQLHKFAGT